MWNHTNQQGEVWNHTNKGITDETKLTWIGKFRLTPPLRGLTEINSKGSGYKTSLTWGAIALPKILWLLERQGVAPSDLFVICEDSCLPTAACAPGSLSTKVKHGKNLWCGAVRKHKARPIDSVVDASNGSLALSSCSINVMAPVCGIEFPRTWVQMYKISPTAWTVDYRNQVLVASRLLQVNSVFLARSSLQPPNRHLGIWRKQWSYCSTGVLTRDEGWRSCQSFF